jgi:hypothetical protein
VVIVVVALVLRGLAYYRADAGAGCSADKGSFEATAEDRAEDRATGAANESAFARADAALAMIVVVIVVIVRVAVVVVVTAACAVTHAVVVGAVVVVVVLRGGGKDTGREQDRSEENRFSELVHPRLDAGWRLREIFGSLFFQYFAGRSLLWLGFRSRNLGLRRGLGQV